MIVLFPPDWQQEWHSFDLFTEDGCADGLLPVEWESAKPLHLVHSSANHLAFVSGLIVLQAWTRGLLGDGPSPELRPVLVVTARPAAFRDAFLRLHLPAKGVREVSRARRLAVFAAGRHPWVDKRGEHWDTVVGKSDTRTHLHNFFPASRLDDPEAEPRLVCGRAHLGRHGAAGAAVLVTSCTSSSDLAGIRRRHAPLLEIVQVTRGATGAEPTTVDATVPRLVFHDSPFSPSLGGGDGGGDAIRVLPDARFERFCADAEMRLFEPVESDEISARLTDLDGALAALMEEATSRPGRLITAVVRSALRLRSVLLSLPTGIGQLETALVMSELPNELRYGCAVLEPLRNLESRRAEMAAAGEWPGYAFEELIRGFHALIEAFQAGSPKREPVYRSIAASLAEGRRVALAVESRPFAAVLKWVLRLDPVREGVAEDAVVVLDPTSLGGAAERDCVLLHAFDPAAILPGLTRAGTRRLSLVLWRNELRFVSEPFLRASRLVPGIARLLRPVVEHLDKLPGIVRPTAVPAAGGSAPLADHFERMRRLFLDGTRSCEGVAWFEPPERPGGVGAEVVQAHLVRLEGDRALLLEVDSRVPYVWAEGDLETGPPATLRPGARLVIVDAMARDTIAHKTLEAMRGVEAGGEASRLIERWREELRAGAAREGLNWRAVFEGIKRRGCTRDTVHIVGHWARGDSLGPLDPQDIRRVGEVVRSEWLMEHWGRVAGALQDLRSDHRLFGRQITQLIQRVAVGHEDLSPDEGRVLERLRVSLAEIQDAVTLLGVEEVSSATMPTPVDQLGTIMRM